MQTSNGNGKQTAFEAFEPMKNSSKDAVRDAVPSSPVMPRLSVESASAKKEGAGPRGNLTGRQISGGRKPIPKHVAFSRCLVDNAAFTAFTTFLTLYALTGDDLRILLTERPSDMIFNVNNLICLVVFSAEVVLSCMGKNDYYLGFFFWLDVLSTATLVLDLTWVADAMQGDSTSTGDDFRQGRTARAGRAGRVVRVLRLVRILKLYKAYYEARQRKAERERRKLQQQEEEDWDEADYEALENQEHKDSESRVGKKLSETTTRKVIVLILTMLTILPLLSVDQVTATAPSTSYGANSVWQALEAKQSLNTSDSSQLYDKAILSYMFYHNWFAVNNPEKYCPTSTCSSYAFLGSIFWIGIKGQPGDAGTDAFSRLQQASAINNRSLVENFGTSRDPDALALYGDMPSLVKDKMLHRWDTDCSNGKQDLMGFSLLDVDADNLYKVKCPGELRPSEIKAGAPQLRATGAAETEPNLIFFFDIRPYNRATSGFALATTFVIMVLLIGASLFFNNDANRLVLTPVEKMVERVEAIRANPLLATKMADDEFKTEEIKKAKLARQRKSFVNRMLMDTTAKCKSSSDKEIMETVILEKTIIKLGSLLALGFGEAGADIIGKNMSGSDSAGVNAMVPGRKCDCVVGIVRVRNFSTATEVLQAKVMMFSNQIAEIVHGVCSEFQGAPNKNNGESFLVIWKHPPCKSEEEDELQGRITSEGSIVASATIIGSVHRSPLLSSYREHPGLQNRLGSNCRVHVCIGLHRGWAIEGAVGSEFKIDCSYLSPNVSIATSVERATEYYGVSLTVAQSVVEPVSIAMRSHCRLIDKVIITGSPEPMELYCLDLDYMSVDIDTTPRPKVTWNTRQRFKVRQWMEQEKASMATKDLASLIDNDEVIAKMRQRFTVKFFQLFNMGFQNYSQGEWKVARRMLSEILEIVEDDGPSTALLRFMEAGNWTAPKGWLGVRELALGS
eukprot:TRINITY_DN92852_c0_g1_i1.p1 TRINITY_DN92852_c0_g1~~TRINITY_DN92852_c0_g1_i1.p1  ORF type:complete len:961 (+),score=168.67 TRINITY_DN92852_c0_g1_i1:111-2993(+)